MIELEFVGAAKTVTGSKHLVRTSKATVLLDCGLYQGRRFEAIERNQTLPLPVDELDAVVLSHAHIDHSGALPVLCKRGFRGPIYATPATRDLCAAMLEDAASIQASDAHHIKELIERERSTMAPVEPLFDQADVAVTLAQMVGIPYHAPQLIAPGVTLTFLDAGHVLGSAIVVLDLEDEGTTTRLAFTGDLGRPHLPILRDPEIPTGVQYLISESTYGDRLHDVIEESSEALALAIERTFARGGKVIIPSFALERAQEVVFELKRLLLSGRLPSLRVYVDSPLTVRLTDVFKLHPDCYDAETFALLQSGTSPFEFDGLRYVSDVEESKAIDASPESCVIISASGMCEAGRVLHHLRCTIEDPRNTVIIVGFQAPYTLGRRLVERRPEVRIFGVMRPRAAEVVVLDGFSAHADQAGLVAFADAVKAHGKLRRIFLVHGEPEAQAGLTAKLAESGLVAVSSPGPGDRVRLEPATD